MSTTKTATAINGVSVVGVGLDAGTSDRVRQALLRTSGAYLGTLEYPVQHRELSQLLTLPNTESSVCIIDFDTNRELATHAAMTIRPMLRGRGSIVAVSEQGDANLILDAMRGGCSEYLIKPLTVEDLSHALVRLHDQLQDVQTPKSVGKTLGFLGCRGGIGTTTLAVHLGTFIARLAGKKTLIIDQHPSLGHVALYLGTDQPQYDFYELVENVSRLDAELLAGYVIHHSTGVEILASPARLNGSLHVSLTGVGQTLQFLTGVYDVVIVDCPSGFSDLSLTTLECCDEIYIVASPEIAALRDLSRYLERLEQSYISPDRLRIVVNRYSSDAAVTLEQIQKAIGRPIAITIPNSYAELTRAINSGTPVSVERRSDFSSQLKKWAQSVMPMPLNAAREEKRKFVLWR